jgi:hypothetical protein
MYQVKEQVGNIVATEVPLVIFIEIPMKFLIVFQNSKWLNSKFCFVLSSGVIQYIWIGKYSSYEQAALKTAKQIQVHIPTNQYNQPVLTVMMQPTANPQIKIIQEGNEPDQFWEVLNGGKNGYVPKTYKGNAATFTPRLFHFSSGTGTFRVNFCENSLEYLSLTVCLGRGGAELLSR